MYILKQTNLLKFGLITIGIIISLFCFYVIVGFLGIEYLMQPYKYGTFFAWAIIIFSIFYRFTFLLLTIGVFFGILNVLEWHMIFAIMRKNAVSLHLHQKLENILVNFMPLFLKILPSKYLNLSQSN